MLHHPYPSAAAARAAGGFIHTLSQPYEGPPIGGGSPHDTCAAGRASSPLQALDRVPRGCEAYMVDDAGAVPGLRVGDCVIVSPRQRRLPPSGLFLVALGRAARRGVGGAERMVIAAIIWRPAPIAGWFRVIEHDAAGAPRLFDGPLADCARGILRGRAIGILRPSAEAAAASPQAWLNLPRVAASWR